MTYDEILFTFSGDHTEVIELDFDPKTVTYEDLLEMFWANHEYGLTTKLKRQVIVTNSLGNYEKIWALLS